MASIILPFTGYPAMLHGKAALFDGIAEIILNETPRLPITIVSGEARSRGSILTIPERPLQRPLRWGIERVVFEDGRIKDCDDARRFITGRYWSRIPALLYAKFLLAQGTDDMRQRAAAYETLSGLRLVS